MEPSSRDNGGTQPHTTAAAAGAAPPQQATVLGLARLPSLFHQTTQRGAPTGTGGAGWPADDATPQAQGGGLSAPGFLDVFNSMGSFQLPPSFWADQAQAARGAVPASQQPDQPGTSNRGAHTSTDQPQPGPSPSRHAAGHAHAAAPVPGMAPSTGAHQSYLGGLWGLPPSVASWWGHSQGVDPSSIFSMPHQQPRSGTQRAPPSPGSGSGGSGGRARTPPTALLGTPAASALYGMQQVDASAQGRGAVPAGNVVVKEEVGGEVAGGGAGADALIRAHLGQLAAPQTLNQQYVLPPIPPLSSTPFGIPSAGGMPPSSSTGAGPSQSQGITPSPQLPIRFPVTGGPAWQLQQQQQQLQQELAKRQQQELAKQVAQDAGRARQDASQPSRPPRPKPRHMPVPAASPFQQAAAQETPTQGAAGDSTRGTTGWGSGGAAAGNQGTGVGTVAGGMQQQSPFGGGAQTGAVAGGSGSGGVLGGGGMGMTESGSLAQRYPWQVCVKVWEEHGC